MAGATFDVRVMDARVARTADTICHEVAAQGGQAHYVGGCVRDALLGHQPEDLDIEVFGLEPGPLQAIVERIQPVSLVGASFGVLKLHGMPIDVSIPRRERKAGQGHRGFEIDADPWLDVAQAAARRDFTINTMAWDPLHRELIDPFNGRDDLLEHRVLRHTSHQFAEDPLRVLRGMQFVARFGLTADPATVSLCRAIEPEGLAAERVLDEWQKLLIKGERPSLGLQFLESTGWIRHFPELEALVGVRQDPQWHPEGDVWVHTGHVLDAFAERRCGDVWEDLVVGFACLCHDLGKATTTAMIEGRWRSPGHEEAGVALTRSFLARLTNHAKLADEVAPLVADHLKPDQLHQAGSGANAVRRLARRVGRLDRLVRVAKADRDGRPPSPRDDFPAGAWLLETATRLDVVNQVPQPLVLGRHLIGLGFPPGPQFGPVLAACYEAQLDGEIADITQGIELAARLLAK